MRRVVIAAVACFVFALPVDAAAQTGAPEPATCGPAGIDPASYRLTTEAQALNVLRPREPWWEPYGLWKGPREIGDTNEGATTLAERAKELDDRNLLAHGHLARQYVVMAVDAQKAEAEWDRVLASGGAVVWTGRLPDVDPRSLFLFAFDRTGIRIYRFLEVAGKVPTHFGVPEFPGPESLGLWRALGGCVPGNVAPAAEIPWRDVVAIGGNDWVLRFELASKVSITSDRGNRRNDDTLEIALHGQPGHVDFRYGMTRFGPRPVYRRPVGPDPGLYQERVRQMLVKFFDPGHRIALPKLGRGYGW